MEEKLYKLCTNEADEIRWSNDHLFIWIDYYNMPDFIEGLAEIFGLVIFDDGGFDGNMQKCGICIELTKVCSKHKLENVFPRDCFGDDN